MAEWLGAHMQRWPLWAIVLVLVIAGVIWFLVETATVWPYSEKRHDLGEKRSHDKE